MKRLRVLSFLAIVLVSTNGCLGAASKFGANIRNSAIAASGVRTRVDFSNVLLEKGDKGKVIIRGMVKYNPPTVGGEEFINMQNRHFEIELLDEDGDRVSSFPAPIMLAGNETALRKNLPLAFSIEQVVSPNIWGVTEGVKIKGPTSPLFPN